MNAAAQDSIHVGPILLMLIGMLVVAAAVVVEFDGPLRVRARGSMLLAAAGVGILIVGALLLGR